MSAASSSCPSIVSARRWRSPACRSTLSLCSAGPQAATKLNLYTLTFQLKILSSSSGDKPRALLATGGWDQFAKADEGAESAQLLMNGEQRLGAFESYGDGQPLTPNEWHCVSAAVDTMQNTLTVYIDGEHSTTIKHDKIPWCMTLSEKKDGGQLQNQQPGGINLRAF